MGVMTPNEIRRELDLPAIEHGEDAFIQVNVQPLKKAVKDEPEELIKDNNENVDENGRQ